MHWSQRYIGQPYIAGVADCAALAEQVAKEVLGIEPGLPATHETSLRGQAEQISNLKDRYAVMVDKPIDGHPVLFIARGRFFHVGVCCHLAGETWVLHADQSSGYVICQRMRDMTRWAYQLEGFYQWM